MEGKHCTKCREYKPLEDFARNRKGKFGRRGKCKLCIKAQFVEYFAKNKEVVRARARRWWSKHKDKVRTPETKDTVEFRESKYKSRVRYYAKNPHIMRVHKRVSNAVHSGKLKASPCVVCGNDRAVAHHYDYSKPLDVTWLCQSHHSAWHRVFLAELSDGK